MMYERLAEILDQVEVPYETARAVLEVMRDPGPEVLTVGIQPDLWRAAFDALLASADATETARAAEATAQRKALWATIRRELEDLGCRIWQSTENDVVWRVEAPGVDLEVDLASGDVEGLSEGPIEDPIGELPRLVRSDLHHRRTRLADRARREALQKTHTWSRDRRAWVPNDGDGPIISGGGSAP